MHRNTRTHFNSLSVELAQEIIRLAALPDHTNPSMPTGDRYADARSLALVSRDFHQATMPHMLNTVSLPRQENVMRFIESIKIQNKHRSRRSENPHLAVDYSHRVRHVWITELYESLVNADRLTLVEYGALYQVLRTAYSIGLQSDALSSLYYGVESEGADPARDWHCTRLTLAGDSMRWNPLTSSSKGLGLMSKITHLVIWNIHTPRQHEAVPDWVRTVPFRYFPALTHFAFSSIGNARPLGGPGSGYVPTEMVVYVRPQGSDSTIFGQWAASGTNASGFGTVVPLRVKHRNGAIDWQQAYVEGQADSVWDHAARIQRH